MFIYNKNLKVIIINGPNLNLISKRESIYLKNSFKKVKKKIINYNNNYLDIKFYNSNCEGKIINFIQKNLNASFMIINPGAYSHYSVSLLDCLKIFKGFIIEVHITNIYSREYFRKNSIISLNTNVIISGMGLNGYFSAIDYIFKIC